MKPTEYSYVLELRNYTDFIEECRQKEYTGVKTFKHHITPQYVLKILNPKISKKEIDHNNIVKLSHDDHVHAHYLLSLCFPKGTEHNIKNLWSVQLLDRYKIKHIKDHIKLTRSGINNSFFGKNHTEKSKELMRQATLLSRKGVSYKEFYKSEERAAQQIEIRSLSRSKSYFNSRSEFITENKIIFFENNSQIEINGILYKSIKYATRILKWPKNKLYDIKRHYYAIQNKI